MISLHPESGEAVRLYFRCQDAELELFVIWKWHTPSGVQIIELAPSKPVQYRIGDSEIKELEWDLSTHEVGPYLMGTYLPSRHVPGTIQKLYNSSEFVLQVTPQNSVPITGIFNPEGLYWAAKPVLESCGDTVGNTSANQTGTSVRPTPKATMAPAGGNSPATRETPLPPPTARPEPATPTFPTVASDERPACCISIGSSKQEVQDVMGRPEEVVPISRSEEWWYYRDIQITIHPSGEAVTGWSYSGPLKQSPIEALSSIGQTPLSDPDGLITSGSSVEEVVAIVGEPVSVSKFSKNDEYWWQFSDSTIYISPDGRLVTSWTYSGPLRGSRFKELASITARAGSDRTADISIGSTVDQVVAAMGEPDAVSHWGHEEESWWQYHDGTVYISPASGRVTSWAYAGSLQESRFLLLSEIRTVPNSNPGGKIGRGSTVDEVVAVLGEPDSVANWGEDTWWYFHNSTVFIDPDSRTVTDWYYDGSPEQSPFG